MSQQRNLPPGIREHHGKYQVRYYDPDGKEKSKHFDRLTDAKKYRASKEADKARGVWTDDRQGRVPFAEWNKRHRASKLNLRPRTRATDEGLIVRHILPTFADTPIGAITPLRVQDWINRLAEGDLSAKTVRECYRLLSSSLRAAVDARLITESPCRGITLPRVERTEQRFLDSDEIEVLANATDPHYRTLVYAAAYLGCRWGELAGLRRSDLDLLRRQVRIAGTLEELNGVVRWVPETKSNASRRTLTIPRFLVDMLARHLSGASESEYVFTNKRGLPLKRSSFRESVWLPALKASGLEHLRFHDLRHSHAAMLVRAGVHPKALQVRLGHSSITTSLNTYGHLYPSLDEELSERLDEAFSDAHADLERTSGGSDVLPMQNTQERKAL